MLWYLYLIAPFDDNLIYWESAVSAHSYTRVTTNAAATHATPGITSTELNAQRQVNAYYKRAPQVSLSLPSNTKLRVSTNYGNGTLKRIKA
jgi:hypothetical protein